HDQIDNSKDAFQDPYKLVGRVSDDGLEADVAPDGVETVGDEQGVGVDAEGRQQLASNGDNTSVHNNRSATRSTTLAYTAAMRSSAITPTPPGRCSRRLAGNGLMMSKMRKRKNPATAPFHPMGARNSVTSIPITSSITTGPGSVV